MQLKSLDIPCFAKVSPKKSRKLEEYKVAKAIIQLGLPGLLVTKWPCLRGQSVRTDRKLSGAINSSCGAFTFNVDKGEGGRGFPNVYASS